MKKLVAMILVCMLCLTTAYAAEWTDGLSPAKPNPLVDEVNLDEMMGYIMLFPNGKLPANYYCDVLEIYLPREDLERGEGTVRLYETEGDVEVESIDFADADRVEIRPLEEAELPRYWGGGSCVEIHLSRSLQFDKTYYVLMDEGCFTASAGSVKNPPITAHEAWTPVLNGDYGISGLYYGAPLPEPEESEEEEPTDQPPEEEETPESTEVPFEEGPVEAKLDHEVGDTIHFRLVLGGDAKLAVIFSENDSVTFETQQFTESCNIIGTIAKADMDWGVVFMDENGNILDSNPDDNYREGEIHLEVAKGE